MFDIKKELAEAMQAFVEKKYVPVALGPKINYFGCMDCSNSCAENCAVKCKKSGKR